eukprot:SAG11_NODE_43_length_20795_cov_11.860456_5_plen_409_part_00
MTCDDLCGCSGCSGYPFCCLQAATQGHVRPQATFYKLKAETFFISPSDDRSDLIRLTSATKVTVDNPGFAATADLEDVWDDRGSGASMEASAWRPKMADGFVFFGDFMHRSYEMPEVDLLVCRDNERAFTTPVGWELVWAKKRGKRHFYGWGGVSPSDDFVALGSIVTTSAQLPAVSSFRLVHRSLLAQKSLGGLIWDDKGSWTGKDGSIWATASPGKTFVVHASHDRPTGPSAICHVVRAEFLPSEHRTVAISLRGYGAARACTEVRPGWVPSYQCPCMHTRPAFVQIPHSGVSDLAEADDPATQLSFTKDAYFTITYHDASSPWWEGYLNNRPNRRGLIPSNHVRSELTAHYLHSVMSFLDASGPDTCLARLVPIKSCTSLYRWPQPGQPVEGKDLHFGPVGAQLA